MYDLCFTDAQVGQLAWIERRVHGHNVVDDLLGQVVLVENGGAAAHSSHADKFNVRFAAILYKVQKR